MGKVETEQGIFTTNELTGQTAEEVYQGYLKALEDMDKLPQPSETERLEALESALLEIALGGM